MALDNLPKGLSDGYEKFAKRFPEFMAILLVILAFGADIVNVVKSALSSVIDGVRDRVSGVLPGDFEWDEKSIDD